MAVLDNAKEKERGKNVLILDKSAFYPTSGGQVHDLGNIKIEGKEYQVYNVEKVGHCFLHFVADVLD